MPWSYLLHHFDVWSTSQDEAPPSGLVRQVSDQNFDEILRTFPPLEISPIGSYNHWDRRECAVANAEAWKGECSRYQKAVLKGKAQIPKVIHQIWIGPKEPPCLWIDTFRVEYLAAHPDWSFHLWSDDEVHDRRTEYFHTIYLDWARVFDFVAFSAFRSFLAYGCPTRSPSLLARSRAAPWRNEGPLKQMALLQQPKQVAKLPMINDQIYHQEKMWQCKADILRLEFLWHHGGLYVDADMISVDQKGLDRILELGNETGWVIAYEPDTKDKPYSILGNSVIACTPHHPLTLMLILFLKQTYHQKRNHIEVFAVTGPVMYTKCLVDSGMPISLAPQEWLYPAFHFVPNPDAINFSAFPKCLMFQFGYTCSGLEGYVKSKNRCKKARQCPFHSKKAWPLGAFKELPSIEELEAKFKSQRASIPQVIHQVIPAGLDSHNDPQRWRQSWYDSFCQSHPGFKYRTWTKEQLQGRKWFCANLYVEPWDDHAVTSLMMEVLFEEGGFYVPLSTLHQPGFSEDHFFLEATSDEEINYIEGNGGVVGVAKGSPECFRRLMDLYDHGHVPAMATPGPDGPRVVQMGFRDGLVSQARFSAQTQYLGAPQVPCLAVRGIPAMRAAVGEMGLSSKSVFVTDREFFQMDRLRQEMPGFLDQLGPHDWDAVILGLEWDTGSEEVVIFDLVPGGRPRSAKIAGFVANFGCAPNEAALQAALAKCLAEEDFEPSPLFEAAGQLKLRFLAEKYAGSMEEARLFRSMPLVHRAFKNLAGHEPPMHFENHELHGNLMKGFHSGGAFGWNSFLSCPAHVEMSTGNLRFEMILEPNGGIMFRCWNDDNSTNSEVKMSDSVVEWLKVYFDHQVRQECWGRDTITASAAAFAAPPEMAFRTSLAVIVLWQLSTADELQRLADWSLEECGKYKICDFFCDVDYYVYPQSSCQEFCHRDIDDLWDVFDSFCDIGLEYMDGEFCDELCHEGFHCDGDSCTKCNSRCYETYSWISKVYDACADCDDGSFGQSPSASAVATTTTTTTTTSTSSSTVTTPEVCSDFASWCPALCGAVGGTSPSPGEDCVAACEARKGDMTATARTYCRCGFCSHAWLEAETASLLQTQKPSPGRDGEEEGSEECKCRSEVDYCQKICKGLSLQGDAEACARQCYGDAKLGPVLTDYCTAVAAC
ncbi:unnamed protein product [Symbiodinium sp. KB8]|nr:unnamed protein product [Symbiodinium sp. KB8]